ncbi:MAG: hypothetical protein E7451_04885 [Ruminococcaceae bacterium]|nr:hypothetical protein [Oscillospiraceae bacterium]
MKKIWYFIRNIVLSIVVVIALTITTLWIAITSPLRFLSYRKSHFYRNTGTKFKVWITDSYTYQFYELIHKNGLPIRYLMPRDPKLVCEGWFLSGTTLLLHNLSEVTFVDELDSWSVYPEDQEPLSDTIAATLLHLREDHPDVTIAQIRILMDIDDLTVNDLKRAEQDPLFLLYSGEEQMLDALRTLSINT